MSQGVKKGSLLALIGQGTGSIFIFLFQIFAGRWLGVGKYGLLNVLYSAIYLVAVMVIAGVKQGTTRYIAFHDAKDNIEGVIESIKTSVVVFAVLLSLAIIAGIIFYSTITDRLFNNHLTIFLQFIIGIILISIYRFFNGLLEGYRKFHIFAAGKGLKEFLMFAFLFLIIRVCNFSEVEAGWSILISSFIAIIFIIAITRRLFPSIEWKKGISIKKDIIRFIIISGFINLMTQWVMRAGPILLKVIGETRADYYAGLFSAIMMPLNFVRTFVLALLMGLYPNLTRAFSLNNNNLIKRYTFKSAGIVGGIIVLLLPVYYFFGPGIISLLYGADFIVSQENCILLALVISFFIAALLLSKILMARGTPRYPAISFFVGIVAMFAFLFLFRELHPMKLVGMALLICNFLYFIIQAAYLTVLFFRKKFMRKRKQQ